MSHTKESWTVEDLGESHFVETNHRYGIGCNSGTGRVAKVEGLGDLAEGRAHLIAAAPDLLTACENFLYGRKDNRECEAEMRAAIHKAKGQTR